MRLSHSSSFCKASLKVSLFDLKKYTIRNSFLLLSEVFAVGFMSCVRSLLHLLLESDAETRFEINVVVT